MSLCEFPNCSVTFSEFVTGPRIGSGSQGHVHEAYDQNGSRFCLKKLISSPTAFAAESLAYMKKVSSPFVVPIYHAFKTEDFDNLIMELCEGGSLQQFIQDNSLSPEDVWLVITQLVLALHHLHSAGIVHRDIKPSNVLLLSKERPLRVKVCDFGVCRDLDGPTIKTSYGTERFMAPEMFSARSHGSPVDIWALGVLIYFLVEKNYPFTTLPQLFTEEAPVSNSQFGELISSLLQKDPSKRPTAFQLLEHPKIVEYSQDFLAPCNLNDLYLLRRRIRMLENSTVKFQEFNNGINALKQELNQKFVNFESRINERFDSEIANIKSKHEVEVACLLQKLTTIESKLSSTEAQLEQVTKNHQDQISSLTQSHKDSINTIKRQHVLDTEKLNKEVARLSQLVVKLQGGVSDLEISNQKFEDENIAFKNEMRNSSMSPQKVVELYEQGQQIREQQRRSEGHSTVMLSCQSFPTWSSSENKVPHIRRPQHTADRIASLEQNVDKLLALFDRGSATVSNNRLLADYDRVLQGPLKRRTASASSTPTSSLHKLQELSNEISDLLNSQPLSLPYRPPERPEPPEDSADEKTLSCFENQSCDDSSASGTTSLFSDIIIDTSESIVSDAEEKQDLDEVDRSIASIKRRVLHVVNYVQTILTKVLGETENNAFFTEDLLTFIGDSIGSALQAHQQSISNLPNMPNEAKEIVQLENAQISQIVGSLLAAIVGYPLTTESLHIVVDQLRTTLFRELIKLHVTCSFSRSASEASNSESEQSEKEFDDSCSKTSEFSSSLAQGLAKAEEQLAELEKQRTMLEEQLVLLNSLVDMNPSESQESQSSEAEQTDDDVSDIQSNIIIDTERILHEKTAAHQCEQPGCTHGHWWQTMGKEGDIEVYSEDLCTPPRALSPVVVSSEDFVELTDTVRRVVDPEKKVVDVNAELITLDDFEANQQPSVSYWDLSDFEYQIIHSKENGSEPECQS
ncbi:hypothetical protein RCL1_007900 [Eukaryota sp. TZLM3-RCL]